MLVINKISKNIILKYEIEVLSNEVQGSNSIWWVIIYFHKICRSRNRNKEKKQTMESEISVNHPVTRSWSWEHNRVEEGIKEITTKINKGKKG